MTTRRLAAAAAALAAGVLLITGCSSSSSSSSTSSAAASGTAPACTDASIKAAIAPSDTVDSYGCAEVSGGYVAAVQTTVSNGDTTVFWLKSGKTQWYPADGKALCAGGNLPGDLAKFCPSAPSPSPSQSASPIGSPSPTPNGGLCGDKAIGEFVSKAEPGAKVDSFYCADLGGNEVAAITVSNGGLTHVIFAQDEANTWVAVNKSVCDSAAAKSDPKFAALCKQA